MKVSCRISGIIFGTLVLMSMVTSHGSEREDDDKKKAQKVVKDYVLKKLESMDFLKKWKDKLSFSGYHSKKKSFKKMDEKNKASGVSSVSSSNDVFQKIGLSYKLTPLKGAGNISMKNDILDGGVELKSFNKLKINLKKDISQLKIKTFVEYQVEKKGWIGVIQKDIGRNVSATVGRKIEGDFETKILFNHKF